MRHLPIGMISGLLLTLSFGCATGLNGGDKLLKFHVNDEESFAHAPKAGKYVVAYRQEGSGELWQAKGTERKVAKGDELGFTRDDMGRLVAIAGRYETTLGQMPIIAQYACWYRLPDDYDQNRKLRKNLHNLSSTVAGGAEAIIRNAADAAQSQAEDHPDNAPPKWLNRETAGRIK